MPDFQHIAFRWVANEHGLTGLLLLGGGALFAFYGLRVFRLLLTLCCAATGYVLAAIVGGIAGMPPFFAWGGALLGGAFAITKPTAGAVVSHTATALALALYVGGAFDLRGSMLLGLLGLGAALGLVFALICRRTMALLLTCAHGSVLTVLGIAGVAQAIDPAIGKTFQTWASGSVMIPLLVVMLCVTGYSFQAREEQGDIASGSQMSTNQIPGD